MIAIMLTERILSVIPLISSLEGSQRRGRSHVGRKNPLGGRRSGIFIPIPDAVESFDMIEVVVDGFEFFPDPLDVGVDGSVIYVDILTVSHINQLIPVLNMSG